MSTDEYELNLALSRFKPWIEDMLVRSDKSFDELVEIYFSVLDDVPPELIKKVADEVRPLVGDGGARTEAIGAEGTLNLSDDHIKPNQQAHESENTEKKKEVCPCNTPPSTIHSSIQPTDYTHNDNSKYTRLKSGIDSLYIGYVVEEPYEIFYKQIKQLKLDAQAAKGPIDLHIRYYEDDPSLFMNFKLEPKGRRNYPYVLWNEFCTTQVFGEGNTGFNPRVYVEIRSSFLETLGEYHSRKEIEKIIEAKIGVINQSGSGVSRLDVYADILLDKSEFTDEIEEKLRCKSHKTYTAKKNGQLETLYIGEKNAPIQCRMYDKGREREKAGLLNEYLESVNLKVIPAGKIIIRVEFQIRRQFLHEHKIKRLDQLPNSAVIAWKYLTAEWLRVVKKKSKTNAARDENEDWWNVIIKAQGDNEFKLYKKSSKKKFVINLETSANKILSDVADLLAKCIITKKPSCRNIKDLEITLQKGIDVLVELLMLLVLFRKIQDIDDLFRNIVKERLDALLEHREVTEVRPTSEGKSQDSLDPYQ